jgi:hypothetical protein
MIKIFSFPSLIFNLIEWAGSAITITAKDSKLLSERSGLMGLVENER